MKLNGIQSLLDTLSPNRASSCGHFETPSNKFILEQTFQLKPGDFLSRLIPTGTCPDLYKSNTNIKVSGFKSSENIQKKARLYSFE